jgi:hypothetical protein
MPGLRPKRKTPRASIARCRLPGIPRSRNTEQILSSPHSAVAEQRFQARAHSGSGFSSRRGTAAGAARRRGRVPMPFGPALRLRVISARDPHGVRGWRHGPLTIDPLPLAILPREMPRHPRLIAGSLWCDRFGRRRWWRRSHEHRGCGSRLRRGLRLRRTLLRGAWSDHWLAGSGRVGLRRDTRRPIRNNRGLRTNWCGAR